MSQETSLKFTKSPSRKQQDFSLRLQLHFPLMPSQDATSPDYLFGRNSPYTQWLKNIKQTKTRVIITLKLTSSNSNVLFFGIRFCFFSFLWNSNFWIIASPSKLVTWKPRKEPSQYEINLVTLFFPFQLFFFCMRRFFTIYAGNRGGHKWASSCVITPMCYHARVLPRPCVTTSICYHSFRHFFCMILRNFFLLSQSLYITYSAIMDNLMQIKKRFDIFTPSPI